MIGQAMATTMIPTEQAKKIQAAILSRLGVSPDSVTAGSMNFNSDGRVSIDFYIPPAVLEAIINATA